MALRKSGGSNTGMVVSTATSVILCFFAALSQAAEQTSPVQAVIVHVDRKVGTINPNIYGHFAEHLGHCIYEGIWVGPDSDIPHINGIRTDVIEALKKIKPTVIRWPGGCFADSYHWQDGIGPREDRPHRINVHWGRVIENNHFGTHEFIEFCRLVGAEPLIAANVGSGTPQEMRDWLEYLNFNGDSTLAHLRAQNGRPEPFNVRYICIGNENWGCGGSMDPIHYARLYRQFSEFCHFHPADGRLYQIACGPHGEYYEWTRNFFATITGKEGNGRNRIGEVHAYDLHYYTGSKGRYGTATEYTVEQFYCLLAKSLRVEQIIEKHWETMGEYDGGHRAKLAVCEWGTWHEVMPGTNPRFLRQQNTMRDALIAALTLDVFNRHCDKIDMANIAQTVNVLQCMILTDGPKMITTPTYHVFEMYVPHQGAESLECEVLTSQIHFKEGDEDRALPRIAASCSKKDYTMTLSLVNAHAAEPLQLAVSFPGLPSAELASWRVLSADDIHAHNSFDEPKAVTPRTMIDIIRGPSGQITLPPASVNVVTYNTTE
jgi:alpha-N-arabinofuranosidase